MGVDVPIVKISRDADSSSQVFVKLISSTDTKAEGVSTSLVVQLQAAFEGGILGFCNCGFIDGVIAADLIAGGIMESEGGSDGQQVGRARFDKFAHVAGAETEIDVA